MILCWNFNLWLIERRHGKCDVYSFILFCNELLWQQTLHVFIIMLYYVKNGIELHLMIPTHFSIGFDDMDQDEEGVDCVQ